MKTIRHLLYAGILLSLTTVSAFGQKGNDDPIPAIFDKYEDRTGVESITISPSLLMTIKNGKTNDKKTQDLMAKISGLRILVIKNDADGNALLSDLKPVLEKDYNQIMKVKSSGEQMELYVRSIAEKEDSHKANALLFITSGQGAVTVMHLSGVIDKSVIDAVTNGEISISGK